MTLVMGAPPSRRLVVYLPHRRSLWRLAAAELDSIRRAGRPRFVVETPQTEAAFVRALPEAEVLFAWGLARRHVDKARSLRWLHTPVAGVDRVLNPELSLTKVRITSSRGVNSVAVAEHALGLILSLTRGIGVAARAQEMEAVQHEVRTIGDQRLLGDKLMTGEYVEGPPLVIQYAELMALGCLELKPEV